MQFESGCAGCFAGLACGPRIGIINLLQKKGQLSVLEIARHFQVTQPTITHHLQYLRKAGVLTSKKEGRNVYYALDPKCGWENCQIFTQ